MRYRDYLKALDLCEMNGEARVEQKSESSHRAGRACRDLTRDVPY